MLSSYNTTAQVLDVDDLLVFTTNRIVTGCTVTHADNSSSFTLNKPGYYYVNFNGDAFSTTGTGAVTVELQSNGTTIPGAEASSYSAATTNIVNLVFSTIVKVLPSCNCVNNSVTLTFKNTGIGATFENANVTITKLC